MAAEAHHNFLSFDEFLTHWAKESPDQIALEMGERKTTYGETEVLTRRLSSTTSRYSSFKSVTSRYSQVDSSAL